MLAMRRGPLHDREPRLSLAAVVGAIFGSALVAGARRSDLAAVYAERSEQIENPTLWFLAALHAGAGQAGR